MRWAVLGLVCLAAVATAEEADFSEGPPAKWKSTIGEWKVSDGVLVGSEVPADEHAAVCRWLVPIQDGRVSFRFRNRDARVVNFGFDPAKGELKKKGHLFAVVLTPKKASVSLARDKSVVGSRGQSMATASVDLPNEEWHSVVVEFDGETARIAVGDDTKLTASHPEIAVKKTGLILRVSGGTAQFDDLVIDPK